MVDLLLAKRQANEIRNMLGLGQRPIADIFSLLEDIGIILFKRPFEGNSPSAIFMKDKKNYLVIINSNLTLGHQIFSAAHELSHYYFDKEIMAGMCSISEYTANFEREISANAFASHFLMPDEGVLSVADKRKNKYGKLDLFDIVFLQQYFRVSWSAMLIKLHELGYIDDIEEFRTVGIRQLTRMLNYDERLVQKTSDIYISKRYLELVAKCYDKDEISRKRAAEYLHDVYLSIDDIVKIDDIESGGDEDEG